MPGRPGQGWSGPCGGRAAGFGPQVEPGLLAVMADGQVEGEVPAVAACDTGGHGDEVAADGRGPCPGVRGHFFMSTPINSGISSVDSG